MKKWIARLLILIPLSAAAQSGPMDKANRQFLGGNLQEALKNYQEVFQQSLNMEDKAFAIYQIARCYAQQGNTGMAERAFWKLVENFPASAYADEAYLWLARRLTAGTEKDISQAVVLFETILSRYPASNSVPEAWLELSRARAKLRFFEGAEDAVKQLIHKFPHAPVIGEAYFELGRIQSIPGYSHRNPEMAIRNYTMALEHRPPPALIPAIFFALGNLNWELENYTQAIGWFNEVITRYPDSQLAPMCQANVGLCFTDMKDYPNAAKAYETLLANYAHPKSVRENIRKLISNLQSRSKEKLQITAWVANVDRKNKTASYQGDVKIVFGKTLITCDRAFVDLKQNRIRAEGNVRLKWGVILSLTSDDILCDLKKKTALATGNVVLYRRIGKQLHKETWAALELSLSDGASMGKNREEIRGGK